ncbi:MAG: OmpA family protein [Magnetococcus sp. DMHC-6]
MADYLDACPNTPKGATVDAKGCPIDSDGDGVFDYKDNCPNTPQGAHVNAVGCWVLNNINFDLNKADIKPKDFKELDSVAAVLNRNPNMKVEIQGHTDNIGKAPYNKKLSDRRANVVMNYLVSKGINANRLTAKGYGLEKPVTSNATEEGRSMNRRVELKPM